MRHSFGSQLAMAGVPLRQVQSWFGHSSILTTQDQFKDLRGYTAYAARLPVGWRHAVAAWLAVAFDETLGGLLRLKLGARQVRTEALDPEIAHRHLGAQS
jgi:hypothetical protein